MVLRSRPVIACQQGDSPAAVLLGEEAGDEPSVALVGTSDEAVDRLVLTGDGPVRFPTADGAGTAMDLLKIRSHWSLDIVPFLPEQSDRAVRSLYSKC